MTMTSTTNGNGNDDLAPSDAQMESILQELMDRRDADRKYRDMESILRRLDVLEQRVATGDTPPQAMRVVMTPEVAAKLRAPFTADQIRYKPTTWCKKCSNAPAKCCNETGHHKIECQKCRAKSITSAHACIAFVGHAEVESRLLEVDPNWGWKPLVKDERGFPALDASGNLWIILTVAGKGVLGVGDCKGDMVTGWKPLIGDALKNAAYRGFGVAIGLWGAAERADEEAEVLAATSEPAQPIARVSKKMLADIATLRAELGIASPASDLVVLKAASDTVGATIRDLEDLTPRQGAAVIESMRKRRDQLAAKAAEQATAGADA